MSLVENRPTSVKAERTFLPAHRGQFVSLEIGRFVAALLVVLFHVDSAGYKFYGHYYAGNFFRSGHAGVEFFFVLSGFIIFYVHRGDIGKTDRGPAFFMRRIIRIMPMYWLAFAGVTAAYLLMPSLLQGRSFSVLDYVRDLLLIPRHGEMVLNVAWTLRQEFVFYFIFLLAIRMDGVGMRPIFIWQAAILLCTVLGVQFSNPIIQAILSTYNLGFGAGIAVAHLVLYRTPISGIPILKAGIAMFLVIMFVEWRLGRNMPQATLALGETVGPILYIIAAALIVLGGASAEVHKPRTAKRWIVVLGGASYLLYLTHGMVSSSAIRVFKLHLLPDMPLAVVYPILIACTVIAAVVLHLYVEKPVLEYLRKKFATRN